MNKSLKNLAGSNQTFARRHAIFRASQLEALALAYRHLAAGTFDPDAPQNQGLPEVAQAVAHELTCQFS